MSNKALVAKLDKNLLAHIDKRMRNYKGDIARLESAIGAYLVGRQFGWKILLLAHDRKTIANYGVILDLDFRELPDEGDLAYKSIAWTAVQRVSSFWKAVKGQYIGLKSTIVK